MGKSRVEKNKDLYKNLDSKKEETKEVKKGPDLDSFDIGNETNLVNEQEKVDSKPQAEVIKEVNEEQELDLTKKEDIKPNMTVVDDDFKVEQPVSYNKMLKAEELLREKLEKQKELKNSKKGVKRSPISDDYTPEMMQKNINQVEGVDVRKELNIKVRKQNNGSVIALVVLLIVVLVAAVAISVAIFKK